MAVVTIWIDHEARTVRQCARCRVLAAVGFIGCSRQYLRGRFYCCLCREAIDQEEADCAQR